MNQDWKVMIFLLFLFLFLIWYFFASSEPEEIMGISLSQRSAIKKLHAPLSCSTIKVRGLNASTMYNSRKSHQPLSTKRLNSSKVDRFTVSYDNPLPIPPEYKNSRVSQGEQRCKDVLAKLFGRQFITVRPDFLKNPQTNRNLELDCYNHELKLAVEYNGSYHYKASAGDSPDKLKYRQYLDNLKKDLCDKNGIDLVVVPYTVKLDDIEAYIISQLPDRLKVYCTDLV